MYQGLRRLEKRREPGVKTQEFFWWWIIIIVVIVLLFFFIFPLNAEEK